KLEKPVRDFLERSVFRPCQLPLNHRSPVEGLIHHDPAIDHEPDSAWRSALRHGLVRLGRERINRGIDAGRLARCRRKIYGLRPLSRRGPLSKHGLPGERIVAPESFEESWEARMGGHSSSIGRQTP